MGGLTFIRPVAMWSVTTINFLWEGVMRWIVFVLVVLMGVWSGAAEADFKDGNELYGHCASTLASEKGYCMGYVAAVVDVMS